MRGKSLKTAANFFLAAAYSVFTIVPFIDKIFGVELLIFNDGGLWISLKSILLITPVILVIVLFGINKRINNSLKKIKAQILENWKIEENILE